MVHAFINGPAQLEVISSTVLRVHLAPMYVDGNRLGTRSGTGFQEAILAVFGGARRVVICPRSCK